MRRRAWVVDTQQFVATGVLSWWGPPAADTTPLSRLFKAHMFRQAVWQWLCAMSLKGASAFAPAYYVAYQPMPI